jgi:hypothetical protein
MSWLSGLPAILRFLIWLLVVVVVVIVLAFVIHAIGGFDWHFSVGHFHWDVGVS